MKIAPLLFSWIIAMGLSGALTAQDSLSQGEKKIWKKRVLNVTDALKEAKVIEVTLEGKTWEFADRGKEPTTGVNFVSVRVREVMEIDFEKNSGLLRGFINRAPEISKKSAGGRIIRKGNEAMRRVETATDRVLKVIGVDRLPGKVLKRVEAWEWDTADGVVPYWEVTCARLHPRGYLHDGEHIRLVFSEDLQLSSYHSNALSKVSVPEKILTKEEGEKAGLKGIKELPAYLRQHFRDDELFKKSASRLVIIKPNTFFESENLWGLREGENGLLCWVVDYAYGKDQKKSLKVYVDAESGELRGGDYWVSG
ncbi:MAG: hypothetical protein ACI9R3_000167 [Verrucomicrobiales bacterium]|jgi:hypothetical protein